MAQSSRSSALALGALSLACACFAGGIGDPYADSTESYDPGSNPHPAHLTPASAIGSPERFTGEGIFPGVVSAFNAPWGVGELVSIGSGGELTVKFNEPVENDPNNLFGIDLLVFSNTWFIDAAKGSGTVGSFFTHPGGDIHVSADGNTWHQIPDVQVAAAWPTIGYVDSGPYDQQPGSIPTDFTRPVDPAFTPTDFIGLTNAEVVANYNGSGGGLGIDIGAVGLSQISYVRITNAAGNESVEIDGFSDVAPRLAGDVNLDNVVNVADLLLLINAWGMHVPGGPPADFNNDGLINVNDLLVVITNWSS